MDLMPTMHHSIHQAIPYSSTFQTLLQQGDIAFACLREKQRKRQAAAEPLEASQDNPLLPYLIHAAVLFFTIRDMLAFQTLQCRGRDTQPQMLAALIGKLRQLPSYQQLQAVLKSQPDTAETMFPWVEGLSDSVLRCSGLKAFRDAVIQQGIPLEAADPDHPFPLPVVCYDTLTEQALVAWENLQAFRTA